MMQRQPNATSSSVGETRPDALQRHAFNCFLNETNPANGPVADMGAWAHRPGVSPMARVMSAFAAFEPAPPVPRAADGGQQASVLAAFHGDLDLLGREDAGEAAAIARGERDVDPERTATESFSTGSAVSGRSMRDARWSGWLLKKHRWKMLIAMIGLAGRAVCANKAVMPRALKKRARRVRFELFAVRGYTTGGMAIGRTYFIT